MGRIFFRAGMQRVVSLKYQPVLSTGVCLLAFCLSAGHAAAVDKPEPSRHLRHAFQIFLLLEENIERSEWDAAVGIGEAVRAEVLGLAPELKSAAGEETVDGFLYEFGRLLKEVEARRIEGSLAAYGEAEKLLLDIIKSFSFKLHPIIPILNTEVHEALESVRKNNLDTAAKEMAEIIVYFQAAKGALEKEGLSQEEIKVLEKNVDMAAKSIAGGNVSSAENALSSIAVRTENMIAP